MYIYEFYQKSPTSQRMHASRDPPMMLCFIQLRTSTRKTTLPKGGWLLEDSRYPLKDWLITPFATPRNDRERKFNDAYVRIRVVAERAFGVQKSRFRYNMFYLNVVRFSAMFDTCSFKISENLLFVPSVLFLYQIFGTHDQIIHGLMVSRRYLKVQKI